MKDRSRLSNVMAREERRQTLDELLKQRTKEWIEEMVEAEIDADIGAGRSKRIPGRRGYRKGYKTRTLTTRNGTHTLRVPMGFYFKPQSNGKKAWRSRIVPPSIRRTDAIDETVIMSYLSGINTRHIRHSLEPLLCDVALRRSTVSRITKRLSDSYEEWRQQDLSELDIAVLMLDGFNLKIRIGGRVEPIPVLCAIGCTPDGTRVLLSLELRANEGAAAWKSFTEKLSLRGVQAPVLAVIDGSPGLIRAVKTTWPTIDVQRCTAHKLSNLYSHATRRLYPEIKEDYHAIIYAEDEKRARAAMAAFERKWKKDCSNVVKSLFEAGEELITFYRYPKAMWKCLRTTNLIERLNGEFRRRVKSQGSFPDCNAGPRLIFGLVAKGKIRFRRLDGWYRLPRIVAAKRGKRGLTPSIDNVA